MIEFGCPFQAEYVLDLVPFGAVPHIPFENIKLGGSAVRTIIVRNKTNKPVHVSCNAIILQAHSYVCRGTAERSYKSFREDLCLTIALNMIHI